MIANYGYTDAEGAFYITIHQARCARCPEKPCLGACPRALFVEEEDPYGESVAAIEDRKRGKLKYECMECKPERHRPPLPCVEACPFEAVEHSW
jgi:Fe-S-cluster-containing hydrogenase component 2